MNEWPLLGDRIVSLNVRSWALADVARGGARSTRSLWKTTDPKGHLRSRLRTATIAIDPVSAIGSTPPSSNAATLRISRSGRGAATYSYSQYASHATAPMRRPKGDRAAAPG